MFKARLSFSLGKTHSRVFVIIFVMGCGLCTMLKKLPSRSWGNRSIKLISVDGKVMRFKRRVYVREIVKEYPRHGIFDAGSAKLLEAHALTHALDHNSELQPGQPYYLLPLSSAGSRLEELKQIYSQPEIISSSSIDGGRVLRVKLRMKKKDLMAASFLNLTNIKSAENFVMKEPSALDMGQHGYESGSSGFTSEWKPSLNTIAELNSHEAGK